MKDEIKEVDNDVGNFTSIRDKTFQ